MPRINELARNAAETHVVFNNGYRAFAIQNARQFTDLLAREGVPVMR